MADYCQACSIELFGKDYGNFAGLTSEEDWTEDRAVVVLCEGCGPTQVDPAGRCISRDCDRAGQPGHGEAVDLPAPIQHDLKTWPEPFQAVVNGCKTAEFRLNDRGFRAGHRLLLREWDPEAQQYTGRATTVAVTHVAPGDLFGMLAGYVVMSIQPLEEP